MLNFSKNFNVKRKHYFWVVFDSGEVCAHWMGEVCFSNKTKRYVFMTSGGLLTELSSSDLREIREFVDKVNKGVLE